MYTNIDSITNKKSELSETIYLYRPDVIGITEIKPKNSRYELTEQDLQLEGYVMYINLKGRGSVIYVNNNVKSYEVKIQQCSEASVWCGVQLKNHDRLVIGVVYRSPSSSEQQNQLLIEMLNDVAALNYSHTLIMGDFNLPEINWEQQATSMSTEHVTTRFIECIRDGFLFQHVKQPTHYSGPDQTSNILDLVMTNEEGMIDEIEYDVPIGNSHHVTLKWTLNCYKERTVSKIDKYSYDKGNYEEIRRKLGSIDWTTDLANKSVDEMWLFILNSITSAVRQYIPHRAIKLGNDIRRRRPVWMNDTLLARIRKKKKSFERYQATREGRDFLIYIAERNAVNKQIRKAVKDLEKGIASIAKKDPKSFFKYANSKLKTKSGMGDLITENGSVMSDDREKAQEFNNFFSSVFTHEDTVNMPQNVPVKIVKGKLANVFFNESDISKILRNLKPNKSPGPDKVHPMVLKECASELSTPLYILFRRSLDEGTLPQMWKDGHISAI